jgi:predicted  nucleic acid-binding Zn-ribbon protein
MGAFDELLQLQELDSTLDQLRHRRDTLPEREARDAARAAAARAGVEVDDAFARLHQLQNAQRALEDESATLADKVTHVERMLYGGTVKAAKELEAYQADLEMLQKRAGTLDDEILEVMEEVEPVEAELGQRKAEREAADATLERAEEALLVAEAEIDAEVARVDGARAELADGIAADALAQYEQLRAGLGGVGAARLSGARCEGCHLEIPSAQLEEVRRAPQDQVVTCPECGRILVR